MDAKEKELRRFERNSQWRRNKIRRRKKNIIVRILMEVVIPFIIMLIAALIPLNVALTFTINNFSMIKFMAIFLLLLAVTLPAGILLAQYIDAEYNKDL